MELPRTSNIYIYVYIFIFLSQKKTFWCMLPFSVQENKNINLTLNNVEIYQYQSTDLFLTYLIENILQDIRLPVVMKKNNNWWMSVRLLYWSLRQLLCKNKHIFTICAQFVSLSHPLSLGSHSVVSFSQMSGLEKCARPLMRCWEKEGGTCALGETTVKGIMVPTEGGGGDGGSLTLYLLSFLSLCISHQLHVPR